MRTAGLTLLPLAIALVLCVGCEGGGRTGATTFTISGTVTLQAAGLAGVTVTANDGAGHVGTATTAANGTYTIANLVAAAYTVTPTLAGHTFTPATRNVTVGPSATGQDFAATAANGATNTNLFFLHHSTGQGIIDGGVRAAIAQYNTEHGTHFEFWDHGYNGDGLTNATGTATGTNYAIPGDNTDPDGLHNLWCGTDADAVAARNTILTNHQVIAFKSCFPASHIADAAALAERQQWYLDMRDFFDTRTDRVFMVMSTPPLHPLETNATEAANARAFANWLRSDAYLSGHPNVVCFDLFDLLASPDDGAAEANMLRPEYRIPDQDPLAPDSHPNGLANQTVAPIFAQALIDGSQGQPQP